MLGLFSAIPLAFTVPAVLAILALLPALWVLLRITPPRPREVTFPPLRLILDLKPGDETAARTPWWLLALRLLLAGLLILAMAGPIWNPPAALPTGAGPLLLIVDDGWAAAPDWSDRVAAAQAQLRSAEQAGRPVALAATSEGPRDIMATDSIRALDRLRALKPSPYLPDRMLLLPAVTRFVQSHAGTDVAWIADGLEQGGAKAFATGLSAAIAPDATLRLLQSSRQPLALAGANNGPAGLDVTVLRPDTSGSIGGHIRALDAKGLVLGDVPFSFGTETSARARFELPIELRNDISRIDIPGENSAGAVALIDNRQERRRVGLVSGASADNAQPLLAPTYYLAKALAPIADVREARAGLADPIPSLIDQRNSVLILADVGTVTGATHDKLARFVEDGGVLLRFAGTRLASATDDLVPVRLRRGGRVLGGSLSWDQPKQLAPFERDSPFYGLKLPAEVTVSRQVLAEPEPGLTAKTWAALADGTPLVTATRRGKGLLVLVHVTADTTWSNLPLSGLFVDMLQRIVGMGSRVSGDTTNATSATPAAVNEAVSETLSPRNSLDGYGVLGTPPVSARPIAPDFDGPASADHPPGFYGLPANLRAVNTLEAGARLNRADFSGVTLATEPLQVVAPHDLRPDLLGLAFALLVLDALASVILSGGLRRGAGRVATTSALLLGLSLTGSLLLNLSTTTTTRAAEPGTALSQRDLQSVLRTRLAYVITGDAAVDAESLDGLKSLSRELSRRTSLDPGDPVGVDPGRDELAIYPLLYWPVVASRPQPGANVVARAGAFMKEGGTIIFDTRDALTARTDGTPTPEALWLRTLLVGVDVPELEPVPRDHVVTKTFYLLDGFVGRTTIGQTWIEALAPTDLSDPTKRPARAGDDVSPIVITSNDLAAGWASDRNGVPLYPLIPGGARQHELAIRAGINLVMYTLTGNYKADQVHVRDLLERLAH